jgi:hypothetical protein
MLTEQALELYHDHDPHWSADLVVALERVRPGLALEWATECAKALVDNVTLSGEKKKQLNWLDELAHSKTATDWSSLMDKSNQIWHEERDLIHTAIAHLYAALAHLLQNNSPRYRMFVMWAVNVMGDHDFYRQTSLAIPLALFERFVTASTTAT